MSRRVDVTMSDDFYAALTAFADEQECSRASVLLRGAKAILSKSHKWKSGTRGRPFARTRTQAESGGQEVDP